MKKFVTMILALTAVLSLTAVARADVIAGPVVLIYAGLRLLPWLLVIAVGIATVLLLRKFRKKK